MQRCFAYATLIALLWVTEPAWAERVIWRPEKTRAVIAGVLSWQDSSITTFATAGRKDQELYETLLRRGVPPANLTLLLDSQATHDGILEALRAQAEASAPDETFLFYYAGHGKRRGDQVFFLPYDYRRGDGLSMTELTEALRPALRSERTLLLADCCHSGGLAAVAQALEEVGRPAAALTSASSRLVSTSNWTFTLSLLDALNGSPSADRDQNLDITFQEVAIEVADAMRFHEGQQSGVTPRSWFSDLVIAQSAPEDRALVDAIRRYDYIAFEKPDQSLQTGRVVDFRNGHFVVEVQGYSSREPVEVAPPSLTSLPAVPPTLSPEEALRVASQGGKYSQLLRMVEVEPDFLKYTAVKDYGYDETGSYAGYDSLPEGYWVYVYPNWYIWGRTQGSR